MGTPTQAENRESFEALTDAYDQLAILPPKALMDPVYWDFPEIHDSKIKALEDENQTGQRIDREWDQLDEPARDTRRIQYQDNSHYYDDRLAPSIVNRAYECARFIAAPDELGVVRKVGCYAAIDSEGKVTMLNPLDPNPLHRAGIEGYWFVKLFQGTFQPLPAFDFAVALNQVMGYPFPECSAWEDNRFQWGKWDSEVFWLVPSNHALRLYFFLMSDEHSLLRELGGRLVGFTQPIDTMPAAKNVLYAW